MLRSSVVVAALGFVLLAAGTPMPASPVTDMPAPEPEPAVLVVAHHYDKVMVIAEENEPVSSVIGSSQAPYINRLATRYGRADNMQAGYPVSCPSLAAYIIMTSGSRHKICDDRGPQTHQLAGSNVFEQVAASGRQWRQYAGSMTRNCQRGDSRSGLYLVRHAPPPYYLSEKSRCARWDVALGTTTSGALHHDLAKGLHTYSFITPNACNEMHGAPGCRTGLVRRGDNWLKTWMPKIIAAQDFQRGRLVVIVTWDEGSTTSNHIPTLVLSKTTTHVRSRTSYTHCSTLRTTELLLGLKTLGCAKTATSFRSAFDV
jgi:hypothetical protein